ncbi:MAG: hypothetical protein WD355_12235 [Balneolaceae bacterium]
MSKHYKVQGTVQFLILLLFTGICFISCNREIDYDTWVEQELSKEFREDEVLLGYRLGMETRDFYHHGVELNQRDIVRGMSQIIYPFEELPYPATIHIVGNFHEDRLYELFCSIKYDDWNPGNSEYFTDRMIPELIDYFEELYGSGFRKIEHPEHEREAWIKIDGNRRISIYPINEMYVNIEFFDLTVSDEATRYVR